MIYNFTPKIEKAKCFKCKKWFELSFSLAAKGYSKRQFWQYWTERREDKNKMICSSCLRSFYIDNRREFLATVKDLKKRNNLRSYISDKLI